MSIKGDGVKPTSFVRKELIVLGNLNRSDSTMLRINVEKNYIETNDHWLGIGLNTQNWVFYDLIPAT
jgi:hypothetical protein